MVYLDTIKAAGTDEKTFYRFLDFMLYEAPFSVRDLEKAVIELDQEQVVTSAVALKNKLNNNTLHYLAQITGAIERCASVNDFKGVDANLSVLNRELEEFYQDDHLLELSDHFYCLPC